MGLFSKAKRESLKLRLAIIGPSGSGKTLSALKIARGLIGKEGKIAVVDTENGSAKIYADRYEFDLAEMHAPYTVKKYLEAIKESGDGYDCLIIDSLSHAWAGEGGLLQKKEQLDQRGGNSFTNWSSITKEHEALKSAILHPKTHLICTMRSKQEYVLSEGDNKKTTVKKVGMAPVQREGMEYEFDVCLDLDMSHHAAASKDRTGIFSGIHIIPSEELGVELSNWLFIEDRKPKTEDDIPPSGFDSKESHHRAMGHLEDAIEANGWTKEDVSRIVSEKYGLTSIRELSWANFNEFLKYVKKHPVSSDTIGMS